MKFQVISHACLLIESHGKRLLLDPWIIGSAYWRSWWHFPESVPLNADMLAADLIYLTHQHFDHFHYPSLRKFRRDTTILVPRFPIPSMERALKDLGFTNIVPLPHGKTLRLSDTFALTSYQAEWISNSALVVECDGTSMINLNDAKFEDNVFETIIKRHQPFDFMFRSHSSAQAYPECYESDDPADLQLRRKEDYIDDFIAAMRRVKARYAIPFASNVCYLHRETIDKNSDAISPLAILEAYRKTEGDTTDVVVMLPGAEWDSQTGFGLVATDVLRDRKREIGRLAHKHAALLNNQDELEVRTPLKYETFETYMGAFLRSLPWLLKFFHRARIAYHIRGSGSEEWWILDFGARKVVRSTEMPRDASSIISVTPGLLQDAMEKEIVNFVDISKRLHVRLKPGRVIQHFLFKELITMYEMGYFPLRKNLNRRFIACWFARRREFLPYLQKVLRGGRAFVPKVEARPTKSRAIKV
jgi:UDP-MurNAc hydroxylase